MLSTVVLLNSVPFPLTSAFCSSVPVIVPDLFVSTLTKPTDSSPRYPAYVIHLFVVVKIFTFQSSSSVGPLLACLVGVGLVCEAWTSTSWSDGTTQATHVLARSVSEEYDFQRWRQCNCGISGVGLMDGQLVCAGNNGGNWARPFSSGRCWLTTNGSGLDQLPLTSSFLSGDKTVPASVYGEDDTYLFGHRPTELFTWIVGPEKISVGGGLLLLYY